MGPSNIGTLFTKEIVTLESRHLEGGKSKQQRSLGVFGTAFSVENRQ